MPKKVPIVIDPEHQISAICPHCHAKYDIDFPQFQISSTLEVSDQADIEFNIHLDCPRCLKYGNTHECCVVDRELIQFAEALIKELSCNLPVIDLYPREWTAGGLYIKPNGEGKLVVVHKPAVLAFQSYIELSEFEDSPHTVFKNLLGVPYGWVLRRNPRHELEDHIFELVELPVNTDVPVPQRYEKLDQEEKNILSRLLINRRKYNFNTLEKWWRNALIPAIKTGELTEQIQTAFYEGDDDEDGDDDLDPDM